MILLASDVPQGVRPVLDALDVALPDFADEIGASRRTVERWARGSHGPRKPQWERANAWLQARGIDPYDFWADTPVSGVLMDDSTINLEQERARRGLASTSSPATTSASTKDDDLMNIPRAYLEQEDLDFWNLDGDPFDDDLDNPEHVFMSTALVKVERALRMAAFRRQILALTGPPGSGKSTVVRRFYGMFGKKKSVRLIAPASLNRERITHAALSIAIIRDLGGGDTSNMSMERRSEKLRSMLEDQQAGGSYPVLLIDEAHLLKSKALLALKHLWDSHTLYRQLAIVMVGQEPLAARLRGDAQLRELLGRTRMVRLPPFDVQGTQEYLRWRFAQPGIEADADQVFTPEAYQAIHARGQGWMLWTNNVACMSMQYAAQRGAERVTHQHVGQAL